MNKRYFAEISYKGTHYHGWQIQKNANSVQMTIERAMQKVLQHPVHVTGAGRTDTGVHARYFVLHFDTDKTIVSEKLVYKLNRMLPNDISFHRIFAVKTDAHARFNALSRTYRYYISQQKDPFFNELTAYYFYDMDVSLMNEAATTLFAYNNFKAFTKTHTDVKTFICKIIRSEWVETDNRLIFTITSDRFLRNMVRSIVGTMVDVGRRKISTIDFQDIIKSEDRSKPGTSAPACGLFLEYIAYPESIIS